MDLIVARTIALLVVAILVAIAARRLALPYTVGLVIAGMTLALSGVDLGVSLTRDIIFDVILPPLLFEAALNLNATALKRDALPLALLSIGGVAISAAVLFAGVHYLLGWPVPAALLLGVLLAATDPVAVIALFKDLGIGGRTRLLVESESLFNDGVAAVFFALALAWAVPDGSTVSPLGLLLTMSGGGVAVGLVAGMLALLLAGRTGDHLVETAVTMVAAYGAFLAAEYLHVSGVLATVTGGLVVGVAGISAGGKKWGLSHRGREFALELWEFLAFLANSVIFLLIGLAVARAHFDALGYAPLLLIIAFVLLGRAATVYPLALAFRASRWRVSAAQQHVLFWAGLRGALALALALSLPESLPLRDAILIATFAVVTFSVVVQGLSMKPLLNRLTLD